MTNKQRQTNATNQYILGKKTNGSKYNTLSFGEGNKDKKESLLTGRIKKIYSQINWLTCREYLETCGFLSITRFLIDATAFLGLQTKTKSTEEQQLQTTAQGQMQQLQALKKIIIIFFFFNIKGIKTHRRAGKKPKKPEQNQRTKRKHLNKNTGTPQRGVANERGRQGLGRCYKAQR